MKPSFSSGCFVALTLIIAWIVQIRSQQMFCSDYCRANSCTGLTATDCTACITGFVLAGNVCNVDTTNGWEMVAEETAGSITLDNGLTSTCGPYSYSGDFAYNDVLTASVTSGVPMPHYAIKLVFWFIFIDKWDTNDVVTVGYNGTNIAWRKRGNKNSSSQVCTVGENNNADDYLQMSATIAHSELDVQLDFTVAINLANNGNLNKKFWGATSFYLLAQVCHFACSACFGGNANQCTACYDDLPYYLSGTTCNETCLDGYGQTDYSNVCVLCDLKCQVCYNQSTNCTVCTPSGSNQAFWVSVDLACVKPCPNAYYGNTTDHVCYPCLTQCATCKFNQSYCLSCIAGYGWNGYSCYQPCPIGTYNNSNLINCTDCSPYCIQCDINSTYCSSCTLSGTYQAYLLNNICYHPCPVQYYPFNNSGLGPNTCESCDISCYICTDNPTPCSQCNPNYFLYQSACGDENSCPQPDYFADIVTWQCKLCSQFCVKLTVDMYFPNSLHRMLYIDMNFTQDIDFTTFDMQGFQTISFQSTFYDINMFNVEYITTSNSSYRIILSPKGYIFLYNETVTVTTMAEPSPVHNATNKRPFNPSNYEITDQQTWYVVQAPDMTSTEQEIIDKMSKASDKISSILTMPYIQEVTKSGVFMFLLPGAQITSCSILFNSIPAQNHYEGVRFWANFIFFDVPNWQANSDKTKYIVVPPVSQVVKDARMLFNIESVDWRFQRTGHTSFFFFDTYLQIFLVVLCWILLGLTFLIEKYFYNKIKQHMGKIYTFVHKVHELSLMYIGINAMLQWVYFDSSSVERWISFSISLFMVIYFLIYELYIYYDMLAYPVAVIGNKKYDFYATRYGCILRDIRFEQYDMKQPWSPKVWFRPYNYHLLSFYKKILMMVSLPLFYGTPYAQASALIALQLMQITRFLATRPYAYLWRNIVRFILELMLLLFFISCLIQAILIQRIMYNDQATLENDITVYYRFGWVGFVSCFIFNSSFVLLTIYDIVRGCRSTNRQLMDEARRGFYFQKLKQYQQQNEDVPLGLVNKWVKLGNLNKRQYEQLPDINLRVQCYRFVKNKSGSQSNSFQVQMKKIIEIFLNVQFNFHKENNVTVGKKMNKSFTLTKTMSPSIYNLLDDLWKKYASYQVQTLTLKTFQKIQQSKFKPGDKIQLTPQTMTQTIELETFVGEKKVINLPKKLQGFPIPVGDLQILESLTNV